MSLLPICLKIFEKLIFDSFMIRKNLLNSCQSSNIYRAFDANPSLEVQGAFLDLSKAFDKVWHEDLLYKLKNSETNRNSLQLRGDVHNHLSCKTSV